jgi:phage shock protein E
LIVMSRANSPRRWSRKKTMKRQACLAAIGLFALVTSATARDPEGIANPSIDMIGYLAVANAAAAHRESHRVSERYFLRLAREPGTIVLDARSRDMYDDLHIAGAVNLSFPDIAVGRLRQAIPDRSTRILIYCNNNFVNAEGTFPTKLPAASLNLPTYIALYTYGYRNVWELAPQLDIDHSILPFESNSRRRISGTQ